MRGVSGGAGAQGRTVRRDMQHICMDREHPQLLNEVLNMSPSGRTRELHALPRTPILRAICQSIEK